MGMKNELKKDEIDNLDEHSILLNNPESIETHMIQPTKQVEKEKKEEFEKTTKNITSSKTENSKYPSKALKNNEKGAKTEEYLAEYFRLNGYFVVRGVELKIAGNSVTDVDLWLFLKSSQMSKEITIVDIKNKRSPKAFERMLWTKGLQLAINADKAIVATTETNNEITSFGNQLGLSILDGHFLKKIENSVNINNRISEEDIDLLFKKHTAGKIDGDWRGRYQNCKSQLTNQITFDTINFWLSESNYFAEQVIVRTQAKELALRLFYRIVSFICIGLDFISKDFIFEDKPNRYKTIKNGLMFGNRQGVEVYKNIDQSIEIVKLFGQKDNINENVIRSNIKQAFESVNANIIAEYFSQLQNVTDLYEIANELELLSMRKEPPLTFETSNKAKSVIACLLDFWNIKRSSFGLIEK